MHLSGHNSPDQTGKSFFTMVMMYSISPPFLFRNQISYVKHLAIIYRHVHYTMLRLLRGILIVRITED